MEISSGTEIYQMKFEYLPQYFLQRIIEKFKNFNYQEFEYFESQSTAKKTLIVNIMDENDKIQIPVQFKQLEESFEEIIHLLVLIYQHFISPKRKSFTIFCRELSKMIEDLVYPEYQIKTPQDKTKGPYPPRYPMPTETFYQIFRHLFNSVLNLEDESTAEVKYL